VSRPSKLVLGRRGTASDGEDVRVVVFAPEPDPRYGIPSCRIHMPFLFADDKRIAGVDDEQALELAIGFVRQMFGYNDVTLIEVRDFDDA